jgi:hypothetical protein
MESNLDRVETDPLWPRCAIRPSALSAAAVVGTVA